MLFNSFNFLIFFSRCNNRLFFTSTQGTMDTPFDCELHFLLLFYPGIYTHITSNNPY